MPLVGSNHLHREHHLLCLAAYANSLGCIGQHQPTHGKNPVHRGWSWRQGSNPQHETYKIPALPLSYASIKHNTYTALCVSKARNNFWPLCNHSFGVVHGTPSGSQTRNSGLKGRRLNHLSMGACGWGGRSRTGERVTLHRPCQSQSLMPYHLGDTPWSDISDSNRHSQFGRLMCCH